MQAHLPGGFNVAAPAGVAGNVDHWRPKCGPRVADVHECAGFVRNDTGRRMPHGPIETHTRCDGQGKVGGERRVEVLTEGKHTMGGLGPPVVPNRAQRADR